MNLKRHIVKIICFALDRGGEEIKVTFLHVKVNTNQQRKHHVIWFKSLMLQGEVTWSSCVLIRLPFWRNYGDYGIWLGLFICLLIARPAELDGRGPTVCLRVNTHPENGLKSEKSFSSTWEFKSLIAKLKALQSLHQNEQCRHIRKQRWNDDENTTFTRSLILNYWTAGWLFTAEGSESLCVSVCQRVSDRHCVLPAADILQTCLSRVLLGFYCPSTTSTKQHPLFCFGTSHSRSLGGTTAVLFFLPCRGNSDSHVCLMVNIQRPSCSASRWTQPQTCC